MALIRRMIGATARPDLVEARKDNEEARESFLKKVTAAQERGHIITLSQEALERIASLEPTR